MHHIHIITATTQSSPAPLISLSLSNNYSLIFFISPWLIIIIVLVIALVWAVKNAEGRWKGSIFEIDKAEVGLGSGKIYFKPNLKDQQIAYSIWVELSTRKIGLPIDLDHDVISEVYDSWYNFFSITRELIKDIPVSRVKNESTEKIIRLSIDVLNEGLRPHLTKWQVRFRHWYNKQLEKADGDIDPQAIQAKYPKYEELKSDLLSVNKSLMKYRDKMRELVHGLPKAE